MRNINNLDELLIMMNSNDCPVDNDMCSLPTFGGKEPNCTIGIWSWDETRLIVNGDGSNFKIVERD